MEDAETRVMPVSDDLPPPQDGGVEEEAHARAAVEAASRPAPKLCNGIELIGEYEGSGFKEPPYIARREDGQVVQMPKLLYLVAEEIDGRKRYDEIAERVSEKFQRGLDAEMVEMLVAEKLTPLGVTQAPDGSQPDLQKIDPLLALKFRAAVIPERLVNALTTVFKPLFYPPVIAAVIGGLIAFDVWLFGFHGVAQSVRATLYQPVTILMMLGLVVLSAAFHETGHATACRYGGARPGVMGAGLYIVWPAFYTDVTDAYRLDRKGRLRTDLGGIYFNAIFILLTAAAYAVTGFEPLLLIIPLQHMEILHQLLPFLRLDGYYIVSDLTGVPDMFARIKPVLKSLIPFTKTEDSVKELKPWARVAVTVYVLMLVPLLLLFFGLTVMNMPRILATAYDSFMLTAHKIGDASALAIFVDVIQLIVLALVPLGLVITFVQLGRKALQGAWGATDGRPALRGMMIAGAGAAAAFTAYTWAPTSVYKPILPTERGTLSAAVSQIGAIPEGRPALPKQQGTQPRPAAPAKTQPGKKPRSAGSTTSTSTQPASTTETTETMTTSTTTTPSSTTPAPAQTTTQPAQTTTQPASTTPTPTTSTTTTTTTETTATTTTTAAP
jgi:putative peptide zinc metalloprotease protein